MKKLSITVVGLAALVGALMAGCGADSEAELIASARSHIEKRDGKAAVIQLKGALQLNPNSAEARFLLGQALTEQGYIGAAMMELRKARDLKFDETQLLPKLARTMLANGEFKALVDTMSGTTLTRPTAQAELHTALAVAQWSLGRTEVASVELEKALAADPKFGWGLQTKARFAAAKGNFDQALALAEQSMTAGAPNGDVWLLRGDVLYLGKKDATAAIQAYEKALADTKYTQGAHLAIIAIHMAQHQMKKANQQFELMRKAHPNSVHTAYMSAQLAYEDKQFAKAKEITQQLLRVAPNDAKLLTLAGAADLQSGALLQAESKLSKAAKLAPTMLAQRKLLAETYLFMGQPQKAHEALRPVIDGQNPDAESLAIVAGAYLQEGDLQRAESLYSRAVKAKPSDVTFRTSLAMTALAKGNTDVAFASLASIAATDDGIAADMALITARLRRQEFDAAIIAIDLLEKKQPGKPTASQLRGVVHRMRHNFAPARAAFEEALRLEPAHYAATANLVAMDLGERKIDSARQRLEAAIKFNPKNGAAHMALIDVMVRQGEKAPAIMSALNAAITANPADPAPRLGLMALLTDTKDFKGALLAAQSAAAEIPNNLEILDAAGRAQSGAGDDQQAISTFNKIASLQPQSPLPHLRLSDIYARRKEDTAAALSLRRAFNAAPESTSVQRHLAESTLKTKDITPAINAARDLQKRQPGRASGFLFEGDVYTVNKNWRAAETAYRQALNKVDPAQRAAISVYLTLLSGGQVAEADRFAGTWLNSHAKDRVFIIRLGEVALGRRDFSTAERRFLQAIAIDPLNVSSLNNLAWLQAHRGHKGALAYAEKAVALAPGEAPVLDTLAQALALNGELDKAISVQMQALTLTPARHEYRLNLAKLQLKAGEKAHAKVELDKLAELGAKFAGHGEVTDLRKALLGQ